MSGNGESKINWTTVIAIIGLLIAILSFAFDLLDPIKVESRLTRSETMIEGHEKRLDNLEKP